MVRRVLQIFVLPILFSLLIVGGKTSICLLLSTAGLSPHHHAALSNSSSELRTLCLANDADLSANAGISSNTTVPCSSVCEMHLASATTTDAVQVPTPSLNLAAPVMQLLSIWEGTRFAATESRIVRPTLAISDHGRVLASPALTGCFRI